MTRASNRIRILIVDDHAVQDGGTRGSPMNPLLRETT
jgi:hypothetical protein